MEKEKGIKTKTFSIRWVNCDEDKTRIRGYYLRAMKTKHRAKKMVEWWKEEDKFWEEEIKRLKKEI